MPNVLTRMQAPGKSLPAELVVGGADGYRRVMRNAEVVQQRGRGRRDWGYRLAGVGDTCYDPEDGTSYECDASGGSFPTTTIPAGSPNFDWAGLSNVVLVASTSMAKILAASNPGVMYRDPQGNVIYSQPTGNTQNLPVGGGGPSGTFTGPLGSGSFSGISTSTMMMVAVVGLLAIMVMKK